MALHVLLLSIAPFSLECSAKSWLHLSTPRHWCQAKYGARKVRLGFLFLPRCGHCLHGEHADLRLRVMGEMLSVLYKLIILFLISRV